MDDNSFNPLLKGKKLLIGKEPVNGRLMICIPINGRIQGIAVGNPNSVPSSVSRYNEQNQSAHVALTMLDDDRIMVENLKPQNVTYINGSEIVRKNISLNDTITIGKDQYPLDITEILKIATKVVSAKENPAVETFDISHLEKVWNTFHQNNINLQKRSRQQGIQARIPMFFTMGAGALSSIAFACGWGEEVKSICIILTVIGLIIMCYSFYRTKNDTSIEEREKFTEEFQDKYICPNPRCGKFLGNYSYKLMKRQYSMSCPHCKCKFVEK